MVFQPNLIPLQLQTSNSTERKRKISNKTVTFIWLCRGTFKTTFNASSNTSKIKQMPYLPPHISTKAFLVGFWSENCLYKSGQILGMSWIYSRVTNARIWPLFYKASWSFTFLNKHQKRWAVKRKCSHTIRDNSWF